ncbi:Retinol dehydrogenase 7 [Halotydeus destructor]|nr:Retinol dehydrogenase 7 [Halotydeus destructor]
MSQAIQRLLFTLLSTCILLYLFPDFVLDWLRSVGLFIVSLYLSWTFVTFYFKTYRNEIVDSTGKAVFITGCDTGFGHLLAQSLDKLGFQVFAGCYVFDGQGAKALVNKCSAKLHIVKLDVTSDQSLDEARHYVEDNIGHNKLWAIVNNAGTIEYSGIEYGPPGVGHYSKHLEVNTLGVVRTSKAFLPMLRQAKNSRVVIVASAAARAVSPGLVAYSMSKYAVRAFADGLRNEVCDFGMSVATIEPMIYATNMGNRDLMLKPFANMWKNSPETVQRDHGVERFKKLHAIIDTFMDLANPAIEQVVDQMVLAVTSKCPEQTYRVGKPVERLILATGEVVADELSGCDTGFGHLLAQSLDKLGFQVFAGCYEFNGQGANELVDKCSKSLHIVKLDVTNDQIVKEAKHYVEDNLGQNKLWAVVNNAGILEYSGVEYGPPGVGHYSGHLEVNTLGAVRTSKAFLPLLRQTKNSRVVIVSSTASREVLPVMVAYCMSKFALHAFAVGLRNEVCDFGMSVAEIEPFLYATRMGNRERALKQVTDLWHSSPPSVQRDLGPERFEKRLQVTDRLMDLANPDTEQVVRVIELAVMSKRPEQTYRVGKPFERFILSIGELQPDELFNYSLVLKNYHLMVKVTKFFRRTFNI